MECCFGLRHIADIFIESKEVDIKNVKTAINDQTCSKRSFIRLESVTMRRLKYWTGDDNTGRKN